MDNEMDADPEPLVNETSTARPEKQGTNWPKLLLILAGGGFLAILCLSGLFYFALVQTKDELIAAVSKVSSIPDLNDKPLLPNQIAFVGNDNNIWLISPDGKNLQAVTNDATGGLGYRFPTWSPDGRHIAFIGPHQNRIIGLYVFTIDGIMPEAFYGTPSSTPFYLYWSPNGQSLTFLTQEPSGLAMRAINVSQGDDSRMLEEGSPFYWVWSPQGDRLLMHVGGARVFSEEAHLSVLDYREDATRVDLKLAPGRFQAPIWSADGQDVFYVAEDDTGDDAIFGMNMDTLEQYQVSNLTGIGQTYMVISPNNQHIAYLESDLSRPIPLGSPYLVDTTSGETRLITERSVMSMYWSPDGTKLALLTAGFDDGGSSVKGAGLAAPLLQEIVFRWWVYDVAADALEPLLSIKPTIDFVQTVPYFDQYHLSLTFWSPDSRYFVVTSELEEDQGGAVIVVDTTGQESPRQVGEGKMAVWSWK